MTTPILPQSIPAETVSARPVYRIRTHNLSAEAVSHLRGLVRKQLAAGETKERAAQWANAWATGYRAFGCGMDRSLLSEIALEGWYFAHGEDCWLRCMEVDAAQDSAAACGYPSVNWG
jgi:hypothetical protein